MSALFINFDINAGLSINSYRKPGFTCGDIGDIIVALDEGTECVCAPLDGALDATATDSNNHGQSRPSTRSMI